jgi:hypothetical protein
MKRTISVVILSENFTILYEMDSGCKPPFDKFYRPVIDGKDSCRVYPNLMSAIIGAICLKMDGLNTQADRFICKMLGIPDGHNKNDIFQCHVSECTRTQLSNGHGMCKKHYDEWVNSPR